MAHTSGDADDEFTAKAHKELQRLDTLLDMAEEEELDINERKIGGDATTEKGEIDSAKERKMSQNVALLDSDLPEIIPRERRLSRGNAVKIHDVNELPVEVREIRRKSQEIGLMEDCQSVAKNDVKVAETDMVVASSGQESNDKQSNLSDYSVIKVVGSSDSGKSRDSGSGKSRDFGSGKPCDSGSGNSVGTVAGGGECGAVMKGSRKQVGYGVVPFLCWVFCGVLRLFYQ